MTIYEYLCKKCNKKHEILQKMSEPARTQCPDCGQETLQKQVSAAGFQLKGTGWYVTDFKDKKPAAATEKPSDNAAGEAKQEKSDNSSQETKLQTSKESKKDAQTET